MNEFYDKIVDITENVAYKSVLIKHTDGVYKLLMDGCENNIKLAAENGYSKAFIALFNVNSIYRGKITILDMIFPSEQFVKKCRRYNVTPVFDRMKDEMQPFEVRYEILNEKSNPNDHIGAITLHWKIPEDSESGSESDPDF